MLVTSTIVYAYTSERSTSNSNFTFNHAVSMDGSKYPLVTVMSINPQVKVVPQNCIISLSLLLWLLNRRNSNDDLKSFPAFLGKNVKHLLFILSSVRRYQL